MKMPEPVPGRPWTWWFLTALVAFGCSVGAWLQPPAEDADHPPTGLRALLYPIERNGWLRIPRGKPGVAAGKLASVQAVPDSTAVVVGTSDGVVLISENRGRTWRASRLPLPEGVELRTLRFGRGLRAGWALLSDGSVLETRDGTPWTRMKLGRDGRALALATAPDGGRVAVLAPEGVLTRGLEDSEWKSAEAKAAPAPTKYPDSTAALALADNGAYAYAVHGTVIHDDHSAALAVPLDPSFHATALQLSADGKRVWLTGEDGSLLTLDGSVLQTRHRSAEGPLHDLALTPDGQHGWAVGPGGHVMTADGLAWRPMPLDGGARAIAIALDATGQHGWALSDDAPGQPGTGTVWHTSDGGLSWHRQLVLSERILSLDVGPQLASARTDAGALLLSRDGGRTWETAPGSVKAPDNLANEPAAPVRCGDKPCRFRAVVGERGWALDAQGGLLYSRDAGKTWAPFTQPGLKPTRLAGAMQGNGLRFVATDGASLYTSDGERSWEPVTYAVWPAPWYYVSLAAVVALLIRALRPPRAVKRESVADLLVTDKPIEDITDDVLGIHELAQGISRFIRNEQTQPSLTLAVTGEWGTGKSSLLNLLKSDLESFGFSPVWFNAWHHEQEESLIAALYARIIAQGTPGLPAWEALAFRWRLLRRRTRSLSNIFLVSVLLLTAGVGYFTARQEHLTDLLAHARSTAEAISSYLSTAEESPPKPLEPTRYSVSLEQTPNGWTGSLETRTPPAPGGPHEPDPPSQWIAALSTLLGVLGILRAAFERLKAFGVDPAKLAASLSGSEKAADHRDGVGFHARFAKDFADVTRALAPRRMVILVDDLDRCSSRSTLKMLEAINFLVTSGECFVVMAISERIVEEYLAAEFKEIADALPGSEDRLPPHERRLEYARKYLEKLINVEVKLPPMERAQVDDLLTHHHACDDMELEAEQRLRRDAQVVAQRRRDASFIAGRLRSRLSLALAVALCLGAGLFGGSLARHHDEEVRAQTETEEVASTGGAPGTPATSSPTRIVEPTSSAPSQAATAQAATSEWRLRDPAKSPPRWWVLASAAWTVAVLMLWTIRQRAMVVRDSHAFLDALKAWNTVIAEKHATPRAVKKFLNRVRFYAMQERSAVRDEQDYLSSVVEAWLEGYAVPRPLPWRLARALAAAAHRIFSPPRPPPPSEGEPGIPEPLLVGLAALADAAPELPRKPDFGQMLKDAALPLPSPLKEQCQELVVKAGFPRLEDSRREEMVDTFRRLSGGLEVR